MSEEFRWTSRPLWQLGPALSRRSQAFWGLLLLGAILVAASLISEEDGAVVAELGNPAEGCPEAEDLLEGLRDLLTESSVVNRLNDSLVTVDRDVVVVHGEILAVGGVVRGALFNLKVVEINPEGAERRVSEIVIPLVSSPPSEILGSTFDLELVAALSDDNEVFGGAAWLRCPGQDRLLPIYDDARLPQMQSVQDVVQLVLSPA